MQSSFRRDDRTALAVICKGQDALFRGKIQTLTNVVIKTGSTPLHFGATTPSIPTQGIFTNLPTLRLKCHKLSKDCGVGRWVLGLQTLHL